MKRGTLVAFGYAARRLDAVIAVLQAVGAPVGALRSGVQAELS